MIRGVVNSDHEAVIQLAVNGGDMQSHTVAVLVDTGYTGWLTLSPDLVIGWGLAFNRFGRAVLADGSVIAFGVYDAVLVWDGQPISIRVDAVDADPLLGMSLMYGYKLTVENVEGGSVTLERLRSIDEVSSKAEGSEQ